MSVRGTKIQVYQSNYYMLKRVYKNGIKFPMAAIIVIDNPLLFLVSEKTGDKSQKLILAEKPYMINNSSSFCYLQNLG